MVQLLTFVEKGRQRVPQYYHPRASRTWRNVRLYLDTSARKWWEDPDVVVAFKLPRISAALERLMGTNVVRLTDRNYMKELRERIDEDYRENLMKRIKARELKEVERERVLIIEGKTNVIPRELADDPIFMVDKKANLEILKTRAKLKTNREKNSERLKLQGVKWERERLLHEQEEDERINILRQRQKEQKDLEEQYKNEDADKGMDLLRITTEEWRSCEQKLKKFLEQQRAKMKERSWRVPTQFSSDPKDINNILRARKAFREEEKRVRKAIEDKQPEDLHQKHLTQQQSVQIDIGGGDNAAQSQVSQQVIVTESQITKDFDAYDVQVSYMRRSRSSDDDSDISSGESFDGGSSISVARERYADMLQKELQNDVAEGRVISKEQYDHLCYEDEKIMQLRNAKDIRELYQLAEQIIVGEQEPEQIEEEETLAEEQEQEEVIHISL